MEHYLVFRKISSLAVYNVDSNLKHVRVNLTILYTSRSVTLSLFKIQISLNFKGTHKRWHYHTIKFTLYSLNSLNLFYLNMTH